jgi:hypothetical protein
MCKSQNRKMKKTRQMTSPKVNSPTVMDSNDSDVVEVPKNSKEWLQQ